MSYSISVIATVLNEAHVIDHLVDSLMTQTRLPDEIVIVDGGSSDGTQAQLAQWQEKSLVPLRVIEAPGCNIAQGRNAAINAAQGDIIAVTDAGVRLPVEWLANLIAPFESPQPPQVVSGFFRADPHSLFERVVGAITLPRLSEINPAKFLPSSRSVAFKRSAWQHVEGYPEWLDYCEDLVFDFALQDAGLAFAFAPEALAWFRPRPNLSSFYRQYYRYSRGDGKANLYLYRHLLRYTVYFGLLVSIVLAFAVHPVFLVITAITLALILGRSLRRIIPELRHLTWMDRLNALLWLPIITFTGDAAKMIGYPAGVAWRKQHAPCVHWARRSF
ncbi:MAG: glycosyltransferase [Anaerolineae bacterium]